MSERVKRWIAVALMERAARERGVTRWWYRRRAWVLWRTIERSVLV